MHLLQLYFQKETKLFELCQEHPYETEETILKTFVFAKRLKSAFHLTAVRAMAESY